MRYTDGMKKTISIIVTFIIFTAVAEGLYLLMQKETGGEVGATDSRNATYTFSGTPIRLTNGLSSLPQEDSASPIATEYFGNELEVDLDNDGRKDVVMLLTQNTGGSGTFFYLAGALNTKNGYVGTQAMLIGDRIAPQNINLDENGKTIIVNYADRAPGEPMTARPSMGKSMWVRYDAEDRSFGELVKDFEGEVGSIGGERDSRGCLGPAGYSFDERVGACTRRWELTDDIAAAAKLAVQAVGSGYALTVVSFNSYEESGAYDFTFERGLERMNQAVRIRGGKASVLE